MLEMVEILLIKITEMKLLNQCLYIVYKYTLQAASWHGIGGGQHQFYLTVFTHSLSFTTV
jgi:hypothetical protein